MKPLILLYIFIVSVTCDYLETFYEYVENRIDDINKHARPINNSYMYTAHNSKVYNGGRYDFIIVGGGSAGVVLASRLSEIVRWNILLLEAGGPKDELSDIPGASPFLQISDMDWGYLTVPQKTCCLGMKNNQCVYPRGRVIGGSSTINAMIYTRGNKADFDKWKKLGNPGWSYNDVLPYFIKSEVIDTDTYDVNYHGQNGSLHVNISAPPDPTNEYFRKALHELGVQEVDINGKQQMGTSKIPLNINFNKRCGGYDAFIAPIQKQRKNLKILLNAFVLKLLLSKSKANGVLYVKDGKIFKATVKKELILSAGAINTPQLLMLSGIGPAEYLNRLGIDVIHDIHGVGKNLQDHPYFTNFVISTNLSRKHFTFKEDLQRYLQGETPLTRGFGTELITFIKPTSSSYSDIELMTVIPSLTGPIEEHLFNLKTNPMITLNITTDFYVLIVLLKPKSIGEVTLNSKSPLDFPSIDVRYFSDPDNIDLETLYKGIKYVQKLIQSDALRKINATYTGRQPECEHLLTDNCKQSGYQNDCDKSYWYCAIRKYSSSTYHTVGTARMGSDPKYNVVDHNCLVYNYRNFRIVDASVMPTIVNAHTNAAVYMIAEKISDSIKKRHSML